MQLQHLMEFLAVRSWSYGVKYFFIVLMMMTATRLVSGRDKILECHQGIRNSTPPSTLYIKSSMVVEPSKTFAVVHNSTSRSVLCLSQACDPFSYIRDNFAYIFVKDICAIPNGTTFLCVEIFPGVQENLPGNSTVIRHSGTATHSTKEIPTKPSLTTPAVKPGNQDIDKDSSERFNNVVISCSVVIGILVLVIIFGGLYIYKLRKKYIYLVRQLILERETMKKRT